MARKKYEAMDAAELLASARLKAEDIRYMKFLAMDKFDVEADDLEWSTYVSI